MKDKSFTFVLDFQEAMKSQVSKMRLISMFYLMVFSSALLLSGVMNDQRDIFPIAKKSTAILFSTHQDSIPSVNGINVSAEPGSGSEDISEADKKHDLVPFEFDFSFGSLLQWFFRLPAKSLSEANSHPSLIFGKPIWLSVHNLRI